MTRQAGFADALLVPEAPVPQGLTAPGGRPAGKRFDVYRNNVVVSLTEALETGFPVVRKIVGPENFKVLARAFLHAHPPESPVMLAYGAALPAFVEGFEPVRDIGYLADVARLELALRDAYHAADAEPLDPARLAAVPPERLEQVRLRLAPSLRLVRSPWPIHAIWLYSTEPGGPKPEARAEDVAAVRSGYDPQPHLLPPGGAAFLAALQTGVPLGEAVAKGSEQAETFDAGPLLALLLSTGTITDLDDTP